MGVSGSDSSLPPPPKSRQATGTEKAHRFASAPMAVPETSTLFLRPFCRAYKECTMGLGTILLIVLVLLLLGAIPTWPHSRSWGYAPSGGLGLLLVIVVVLLLMGRL